MVVNAFIHRDARLMPGLVFFVQSFNPMCEPNDDWTCNFDESPELSKSGMEILPSEIVEPGSRSLGSVEVDCGFTFPREQSASEDDDELTEAKIRAFLDEKVATDEIVQLHSKLCVQMPDFPILIFFAIFLFNSSKNHTNPFSFSFPPSLPTSNFLGTKNGFLFELLL